MVYFISIKDMQRIYPTISERSARRLLRSYKDSMGIAAYGKITLEEFCQAADLPLEAVKLTLGYS